MDKEYLDHYYDILMDYNYKNNLDQMMEFLLNLYVLNHQFLIKLIEHKKIITFVF